MATSEQSLSKTTPKPSSDRILRWILPGDHTFETDFITSDKTCSTVKTETANAIPEKTGSCSPPQTRRTSTNKSETALTDTRPEKLLTGHDNDPIRPSTDQINSTFLKGEKIRRALLTQAALSPAGWIPEGCLAPYTLLQNMPPLSRDLPKRRWIMGKARWHVPHPELSKSSEQETNDAWNPEDVYNSPKKFPLEAKKALVCQLCSTGLAIDEKPDSLAILTLFWAYMFNVRFPEMQKSYTILTYKIDACAFQ